MMSKDRAEERLYQQPLIFILFLTNISNFLKMDGKTCLFYLKKKPFSEEVKCNHVDETLKKTLVFYSLVTLIISKKKVHKKWLQFDNPKDGIEL